MIHHYENQIISIKFKETPEQKEYDQKQQEAIVAVGTGLAYHLHVTSDGDITYRVTHLASGLRISPWDATTEDDVQAWIERLTDIADWNVKWPVAKVAERELLKFAVGGLLHEVEV